MRMNCFFRFCCFFVVFISCSVLSAGDKIVYIHGWTDNAQYAYDGAPRKGYDLCVGRSDCNYWGDQLNEDVVHIGWASSQDDWRNKPVLTTVNILNNYCSSAQSCVVICHSTGCPIVGKAISVYAGRYAWKIKRVLTLGSAEGGSELAEFKSDNAQYITPSVVRAAYNHHETHGIPFFHAAGYDGGVQSFLIPGEDDGVVAFHSACGYVSVFAADTCTGDSRYDPVWYDPFRTKKVANWTNHYRLSLCGNGGCNDNHSNMKNTRYQARGLLASP